MKEYIVGKFMELICVFTALLLGQIIVTVIKLHYGS